MAPRIEWFEADGTTGAYQADWGYVAPGASGASKTYVFRNTGDAPALNCRLAVRVVGEADMEAWITGTYNGQTFTAAAPLLVGTVAPGASGTVTLALAVPEDAPLSSRPVQAQPGLWRDLAEDE